MGIGCGFDESSFHAERRRRQIKQALQSQNQHFGMFCPEPDASSSSVHALCRIRTNSPTVNSETRRGRRVVRTYWRQRGEHVHAISPCIQRMQNVLTQMNIQLANVISDLSGWTGQRIVRAILAGERDLFPCGWSFRQAQPRRRENQNLLDGNATATPANTTGSDQAQSASDETATAPATQPAKKPTRTLRVFLSRSLAPSVSGCVRDKVSSIDRTVLVRLPVITAVEGAPGTAIRKRAN